MMRSFCGGEASRGVEIFSGASSTEDVRCELGCASAARSRDVGVGRATAGASRVGGATGGACRATLVAAFAVLGVSAVTCVNCFISAVFGTAPSAM